MPSKFEPNLAVPWNPDFSLPPTHKLPEPFQVIPKDVILEVKHRHTPVITNIECLGNNVPDRPNSEHVCEPTLILIHIVQMRVIEIRTVKRTTARTHDRLNQTYCEIVILSVDDLASQI